jgi:hypothetical protein
MDWVFNIFEFVVDLATTVVTAPAFLLSVFVESPVARIVAAFLYSVWLVAVSVLWHQGKSNWKDFAAVLVPASLWCLYIPYERSMAGKGYDIRADLLVIHPILFVASLAPFIYFLSKKRKKAEPSPAGGYQPAQCRSQTPEK